MNAGATEMDGETLLVARVEDRRGISHLGLARSRDGMSNWIVADEPLLSPSPDLPEEQWGLEDPRVTRVDELHAWIITYTAFGPGGPCISLARTEDFEHFDRIRVIRGPEDKNGALLPRRVNGEWVLFHRPVSTLAVHADVWLSRSPDLRSWGAPEPVLGSRVGGWWDSARVGIGPPPLETPEGWLMVYHGVRQTVAGGLYRAGLALLDLDDPSRVLHRSPEWVLGPQEIYERTGDVPGVVFPCGLIHEPDTDVLRLYYGAADTVVALARSRLSAVLEYLRGCPPD